MHTRETDFLKLSMWGTWGPNEHPDFMTDLTKDHEKIDKGVKDISVDTSDLKERVDALTLNMDNIQEEFVDIKEKVESLYFLEDNPVFIALKERVDVCEERLNSVDGDLQSHQAAIEQLQTDFSNLGSTVELLRNDMENGDEALQSQINAHNTTIADHWTHILNLEESVAHILTELTEAKEDIKQLKVVSGQHTTDIQYLKAQQESDDTRLTAIEIKDGEQDAQIADLVSKTEGIGDTENRVSALEATVATNSSNIQTLQNTSNDLNGRVEALESEGGGGAVDPEVTTRLTALEGAVGDWANRDSALIPEANMTQAVTNLVSGQNTQNTNISKNMNDITKLKEDVLAVENKADVNAANIQAVVGRVDVVDGRVTSEVNRLDGELSDVNAHLTSLDDGFAEHETSIDTLRNTNNTLATKVDALETEQTSLDGRVTAIEDGDNSGELASSIELLQNEIAALNTKVDNAISGGSLVPTYNYNVKNAANTYSLQNPYYQTDVVSTTDTFGLRLGNIGDAYGERTYTTNLTNLPNVSSKHMYLDTTIGVRTASGKASLTLLVNDGVVSTGTYTNGQALNQSIDISSKIQNGNINTVKLKIGKGDSNGVWVYADIHKLNITNNL